VDRDMEEAAKKAVIRQMGELETRREQLHGAIAEMLGAAEGVVDDLAGAVREAFEEARETFTSISSPLGMHEFVEQVVGPMTLLRNGNVVPSSEARPRY